LSENSCEKIPEQEPKEKREISAMEARNIAILPQNGQQINKSPKLRHKYSRM
jgi:hypothetical protein